MIAVVLGMILVRMIWIQLRFFPVNVDYRALVTFGALLDSEQPSACYAEHAGKDQLWALLTDNELVSDKRYRWFKIPGLALISRITCGLGAFTPQTLQWLNYVFFGGTVFLMLIMVRILTGSWLLGLFAAAMLLSRGQLVAKIGELTAVNGIMFLGALMMSCFVHYLRTASWVSFAGTLLGLVCLTMFDISWIVSLLALPTVLLCWRLLPSLPAARREQPAGDETSRRQGPLFLAVRYLRVIFGLDDAGATGERVSHLEHAYERGALLRPLMVPYSFWVLHRRRWLKLVISGYGLGFLVIALALVGWLQAMPAIIAFSDADQTIAGVARQVTAGVHLPWVVNWLDALRAPLDLHFGASLALIVLALFQSPARGLHGFFETVWVVTAGMLLLIAATFVLDVIDARVLAEIEGDARGWSIYGWSRAPHVFTWIEPIVLSLGLVGLYNLLKIADARFVQLPQRR